MTEQVLTDPARSPSKEGVQRAAAKIAEILPPTPLLPLEIEGRTIWCKLESLQPIGAFKIRGAWYRLNDLSAEQRRNGVVAFSSGNHAQGVALAAKMHGTSSVIIMPEDAPAVKIENTRALGAEVVLYDRASEDRDEIGARLSGERGLTLVKPFDEPLVAFLLAIINIQLAEYYSCAPNSIASSSILLCSSGDNAAFWAFCCSKVTSSCGCQLLIFSSSCRST